MLEKTNCTRFEVIDHRKNTPDFGRILTIYSDMTLEVSQQDDNKTIKIFIKDTT